MDIRPSEEQEMLRTTVRRFLADRTPAADSGRGPMAAVDWAALAELGVLAVMLPGAKGGMDGLPQDAAIVAEELGRALAITPYAEAILGATGLVAGHGTPDQVERWALPAIAGYGRVAWAAGGVEEHDGALRGDCPFVRWAADSTAFLVVARDRTFLIAADASGLTLTPHRLADGSAAATLHLDGVAAEPLLASPGAVASAQALAQLGYVAEMVGIMATLQDQTADYARQRRQFGATISSFQAVQHKLARMFVRLEQSRSMLLKAALTEEDDPQFGRHVLAAKAYVANAAIVLAEDAVQLHGGMGVTDELVVGRALRRVMVLARLFGGADDARHAVAA